MKTGKGVFIRSVLSKGMDSLIRKVPPQVGIRRDMSDGKGRVFFKRTAARGTGEARYSLSGGKLQTMEKDGEKGEGAEGAAGDKDLS